MPFLKRSAAERVWVFSSLFILLPLYSILTLATPRDDKSLLLFSSFFLSPPAVTQLTDDPQSSWHTKVTVSTALEDGDYTGYIFKKANNNAWKQRYFILRKGMLYYFPEKPPADTKVYLLLPSFLCVVLCKFLCEYLCEKYINHC